MLAGICRNSRLVAARSAIFNLTAKDDELHLPPVDRRLRLHVDAHFACGSERGRYELTRAGCRYGEAVGCHCARPAANRVADEVNLGAEDFDSLGVGIDVEQIPTGCAKLEVASINVNSGSGIVGCYDAGEIIAPTCLRRKLDLLAGIGIDDFPIFVALTINRDELRPIGRSCAPILMTAGHI